MNYFLVMGTASALWIILWMWLVQDTPSKQPLISQEERNYINTSLGSSDKADHAEPKAPVPWRRVFTSLPFLAILVAHTCSNWGWYTLLIETSFYFKQVHRFSIKDNAVASSLPFLTMWFFSMALSKTLDALRSRGKMSTTIARKIATLIASVIPMVCLFALCYMRDPKLAVVIMGVGKLHIITAYGKRQHLCKWHLIFRYHIHWWNVLWFSIEPHRYCSQLCRHINGFNKHCRHFTRHNYAVICWRCNTWKCKWITYVRLTNLWHNTEFVFIFRLGSKRLKRGD